MLQGPRIWYKTVREIVTLERMHRAFDDGLMEVRGGAAQGQCRDARQCRRKKHRMEGADLQNPGAERQRHCCCGITVTARPTHCCPACAVRHDEGQEEGRVTARRLHLSQPAISLVAAFASGAAAHSFRSPFYC